MFPCSDQVSPAREGYNALYCHCTSPIITHGAQRTGRAGARPERLPALNVVSSRSIPECSHFSSCTALHRTALHCTARSLHSTAQELHSHCRFCDWRWPAGRAGPAFSQVQPQSLPPSHSSSSSSSPLLRFSGARSCTRPAF